MGVVIIWNAWSLRATTDPVAYLDDSSVHQQMVRFASASIRQGTPPALRWFPFLNLGSPQFLHYQGLGSTLGGIAGIVTGSDAAFRWSLYLMLVLWPLVIYRSARVFGLPGMPAAFAAAFAPFLMSAPAVGYEQPAYLWIGYGLWAQLCASWVLPIAWAWTWRAVEHREHVFHAVLFVSLTAALHFETGYLAFLGALVFPLIRPSAWRTRCVNAAVIVGGSLIGTAWVTVPLLVLSRWAALNTALSRTGLVRGYGARQDLSWLATGATFDHGRLPVITLAVAVGIAFAIVNWRRIEVTRALVALMVCCLMLSFGPTTWGGATILVPGHADIYFRRFLMGVQLSGIYLAGFGIYMAGSLIGGSVQRLSERIDSGRSSARLLRGLAPVTVILVAVVLIAPAWSQLRTYDAGNAAQIGFQRRAEAMEGRELDPLLAYVKEQRDGRLYAGSPSDWGATFTVGYVPVFKYAESRDVDEVGYTIRTASLMSQPEVAFVATNLSDYELFGVRYVLLPPDIRAEPWMTPVAESGQYRLFVVQPVHYLSSVSIVGVTRLDRSDVGSATVGLLRSASFAEGNGLAVEWGGGDTGHLGLGRSTAPPGVLTHISSDLVNGTAEARVESADGTTVVLSASYDPGWVATVDGHRRPTVQLAPALVGVTVGRGAHKVVFTYQGFSGLVPLFVATIAGFVGVWIWSRRGSRSRTAGKCLPGGGRATDERS